MKIEKLIAYNSWWQTKKVPDELLKPYKRRLFSKILDYIKDRQIISIIGLRRTGKTTLLYQLIDDLLKNVEPKKILFFSFDEEYFEIEEVLEAYRENILLSSWRKDNIYIFLDEVQKASNWSSVLKRYYDLYPKIKFIISGSESLTLDKKTKESLAGRIYDFVLKPLIFREFLELKKIEVPEMKFSVNFEEIEEFNKKLILKKEDIINNLQDYLKKGGFPEMVFENNEEKIKAYVKNSVLEKIVYKDIVSEFKIDEPELLISILRLIANNPGMLVEYFSLAKSFKRNRKTISNYFFYLKITFLLYMIANYRGSFLSKERKLKKAYLADSGIIHALLERQMDDELLSRIIENVVILHAGINSFYRASGKEIDGVMRFEGSAIPLEIKYKNEISEKEIKAVLKFDSKTGIVVTKDLLEKRKIDNKEILFVPAWLFLLLSKA